MGDLKGKVAVITGGGGVLCSTIGEALARDGVRVVLLDIAEEKAKSALERVRKAGSEGLAIKTDVLSRRNLEEAAERVISTFGAVDFLINGAGGNHPKATTSKEMSFFDLPDEGIRFVFDLNFMGTLLASQVFGRIMAKRNQGVILNIASMASFRPLTRTPAYSAAKAAVANFTQWLAVHMAQEYSPAIRVVAIAPGFFLTEQNRYLLVDEKGELTERGKQIIAHTPMGRFGKPEDLIGAVKWLLSPGAEFVTGVVIPIDGGFSAFSGV
ncbi:MAG: Short-chain dehydrogenase/reductase SDR [Acetothermia bacterium 64_32]|nr:MAG: Short-chain dehydrogenase/reductase SDR [Acetothermia bacterium 64_32]HAF70566.1 D-mannonate oxidoreductase [Candidatus Acetothermia bacterium]